MGAQLSKYNILNKDLMQQKYILGIGTGFFYPKRTTSSIEMNHIIIPHL